MGSRQKWLIAAIAVVPFVLLVMSKVKTADRPADDVEGERREVLECNEEFGIDLHGYAVERAKVKPGQVFSDLLYPHGIDYPAINELLQKGAAVFRAENLQVGKNYTLIYRPDSTQRAAFLVYEPNAFEFVVFDVRDTLRVYAEQRPVMVEQRSASGVINSSLYECLTSQNLSPALAMELADIYAWTIDFYRIPEGDAFTLLYTAKLIDGQEVGVDEIQAAVFNHSNQPFYAFRYATTNRTDYFDDKGLSLRKAFLQAPLKFSRISSGYTHKRFHPVQKRWKAHLGTDYAAPTGTPIMAVGDGQVTEARYAQFNGNYVKIKHNETYTTQYLHMSKIASGIKPGARVKQGQTIGYVGSTGLASGPHVCFRFWKNGEQVDHRKEKLQSSEPVPDEHRPAFDRLMAPLKAQLDSLTAASAR